MPTPAAAAPLGDADFVVGPLKEGLDSAAVRAALGAPDSVHVVDNPYDPGSTLVDWIYRGARHVTVSFADAVYGVLVDGPGLATARGLRVGDDTSRVRALYGPPASVNDADWEYPDPRDESGLHVMFVTVHGGRVARIYVGNVLD